MTGNWSDGSDECKSDGGEKKSDYSYSPVPVSDDKLSDPLDVEVVKAELQTSFKDYEIYNALKQTNMCFEEAVKLLLQGKSIQIPDDFERKIFSNVRSALVEKIPESHIHYAIIKKDRDLDEAANFILRNFGQHLKRTERLSALKSEKGMVYAGFALGDPKEDDNEMVSHAAKSGALQLGYTDGDGNDQMSSAEKRTPGPGYRPVPNSYRLLNDFRILDEEGKGGAFGVVLKCQHILDASVYAVKRIPVMARDKGKRPISLKHAYIVQYHQSWIENYVETGKTPPPNYGDDLTRLSSETECLYIQMEYCSGRLNYMNKATSWKWFLQILEAICFIHENGIAHCDISRANILLDECGNVKICDFGLAQFLKPSERNVEVVVQSIKGLEPLPYRAPEFFEDVITISGKIDVYSVGMVAFLDLFSGFSSDMERACQIGNPEFLKQVPLLLKDEGIEVQNLLFSMINFDADIRPSACEALKILSTCSGVGFSSAEVMSGEHVTTASQCTSVMSTKDEESVR